MKRRRRKRTNLGDVAQQHIERFENAKGVAADTIRNVQRLIREGRCKTAVAVLVSAAEEVGRMNSEKQSLSTSDIVVREHYQRDSKAMRDVESINTALEKTRKQLQTSCKLK
jgi:hypothetical protein